MKITGEDIGKKFGRHWIFKHLHFEVAPDRKTAITGKNGTGKSTLLQIIGSFLSPTRGKIIYDGASSFEEIKVAFTAPYMDLIEEFTLRELLHFHSDFRNALFSAEEMAERASLPLDKFIGDFSTGMKQRSKLITVFYFENDLIFMDEPTSNLDQQGIDWWQKELQQLKNTTILIASNQSEEIDQCDDSINL